MSTRELLTPQNCTVIFIDHQPQMAFGVTSIDRQLLRSNVIALARSAKLFKVPTVVTAVESASFSGYVWPELLHVLPGTPVERSSMNSWDDKAFVAAVKKTGRKKLVMAALWTEVCLSMPALEALEAGFEVYMVTDASGGTSKEAHDMAILRLAHAGVVPVTWQQVLLEFQRDWAKKETYDGVLRIVREHSGAYGMGVEYAYTMVHKQQPTEIPTTTFA
jgi:nicotinamidase-related amidase